MIVLSYKEKIVSIDWFLYFFYNMSKDIIKKIFFTYFLFTLRNWELILKLLK